MISYDNAWSPTYTPGSDGYDRSVHVASAGQRAGFSLNITATALTFNIDHPPTIPCTASIRINASTPSSACHSPSSPSPFRISALPPGIHHIEYSTQPFDQPSTSTISNTTAPNLHFWGITGERLRLAEKQWRNETYDDGYLVSSGGGDGFAYSLDGGWVMEKGDGPVGGGGTGGKGDVTLSVTDKKGAEVSFTGSGTAMYLYGRVGPEYGSVSVTLDDAASSSILNLTSPWPNPSQLLYLVSGLDPLIPHTLKLVNLEGKRFSVDRMVVTQNGTGTTAGRSNFLSTTHGKVIFFVVIPLLALCLLTFGICVFFPNIRRNSSLMRIRRDRERARRQEQSQARSDTRSASGGVVEKGSPVSTFDSVDSGGSGSSTGNGKKVHVQALGFGQPKTDAPGWTAWGREIGRAVGWGRKGGKGDGAIDRKGSQAALRPYWMDEDVYSFKEISSGNSGTGVHDPGERGNTARIGGISPSGLGQHLDLLDNSAGRSVGGKLRERPSSSTLSRLLYSSPKAMKPVDSDAMSAKTGRTDRTRDLVIPYEAGRGQGGMMASPRSKSRNRCGDPDEGGVNVVEAEERKGYRQPKPAKSTDTFGIDALGVRGKGKARPGWLGTGEVSRQASYATPPTTSSLTSPTFQLVSDRDGTNDGEAYRSASRQDTASRASSASWATLIRPINALLAKRASSSTTFSSIPSPGLPTMASTVPTAPTVHTASAPQAAIPALTHLQIPISATDARTNKGASPATGSVVSSYPLTPTTASQYTEAHIQGYTRGVKQGASYLSKGPEEAGKFGDIGEPGRSWRKHGTAGHMGSTRAAGREASEYRHHGGYDHSESPGYQFTSSLPSDLSPSSPLPSAQHTASSASHYSGTLAHGSYNRHSGTSSQGQRQYTKQSKHRTKYSRDFPPAHPFAAANQRNRYSASPSEKGSEISGRWMYGGERAEYESSVGNARAGLDAEADAGVRRGAGADVDVDVDADADALSTRGAPPSVRLSIKSTFTGRSDLGALSPQFFPWHLRRDSAATAHDAVSPAAGVGMRAEANAPSSWKRGPAASDTNSIGSSDSSGRYAEGQGVGVNRDKRKSVAVAPLRVGEEQVGEDGSEDEVGDRLPIILYT